MFSRAIFQINHCKLITESRKNHLILKQRRMCFETTEGRDSPWLNFKSPLRLKLPPKPGSNYLSAPITRMKGVHDYQRLSVTPQSQSCKIIFPSSDWMLQDHTDGWINQKSHLASIVRGSSNRLLRSLPAPVQSGVPVHPDAPENDSISRKANLIILQPIRSHRADRLINPKHGASPLIQNIFDIDRYSTK